ncbi:MAG TPA: hypothetical protein VE130_11815 [Nitrososphaeraceae archaeon]|jgi:predicted RNA-binding Zn-ribbon protein involved in translation (DUF1610 family)|nr:hypothetical protein [Nitrososphaeraceae archaeon]
MKDFDRKQLALNQLKWTVIYLAVAFIIMFFLPFPADLALALITFLALGWYRRYLLLRKVGMKDPTNPVTGFDFKKIKELYKSNFSDSIGYGQSKVKYYCMNCGSEHREIACPKCGSKMKRVGV